MGKRTDLRSFRLNQTPSDKNVVIFADLVQLRRKGILYDPTAFSSMEQRQKATMPSIAYVLPQCNQPQELGRWLDTDGGVNASCEACPILKSSLTQTDSQFKKGILSTA